MGRIKLTEDKLRQLINETIRNILNENSMDEDYPYETIDNLPNGTYTGLYYSYIFELRNGKKYKTNVGVRCGRNACGGYQKYRVENGNIIRL